MLIGFSCSSANSTKNDAVAQTNTLESSNTYSSDLKNYFPFEISFDGERYTIMVATESPELYPKYADFFENFGYTGNGYCWEGHITQVLEELNPQLLTHIAFDPEAGAFFAYADTEESQLKFVELLSPIFSDLSKLESYVKKADRSRIDD
jgi:hypothetical protein